MVSHGYTKQMPQQKSESFWDLVRFAIIACIIVIPIRMFVAQPFLVNGSSMVPTFHNGDYLIIDELTYRFNDPKRGDVVVFRYPFDPKRHFIKRIIGLPNETVIFKDGGVIIKNDTHPEGLPLSEPYISNPVVLNASYTLGPDEYFVMGDNRPASSDSRSWGSLKRELITGRTLVRLFPISDIGLFPGKHIEINTENL